MDALPPPLAALLAGFGLTASLIVAIGAQNAFVLRQGLRREHVAAVVLFCASADAVLMSAGVLGAGGALARLPWLGAAVSAAGAAFLLTYGLLALRRALRPAPGGLEAAGGEERRTRLEVLAQAAAFTLLNPHVYLDTLLLVGSVGARQAPALRGWFVAGGGLASAAWFASLGFGARRLWPWFASPRAWRLLDAAVGAMMLALAWGLAVQVART